MEVLHKDALRPKMKETKTTEGGWRVLSLRKQFFFFFFLYKKRKVDMWWIK